MYLDDLACIAFLFSLETTDLLSLLMFSTSLSLI